MKRYEFTNKIKKFVDAPFALGDKEKGWDCLNSLADFYDSIGVDFPKEFGEWNEQNYAKGWMRDPSKGRETLIAFLRTLGREVDLKGLEHGDLLIIDLKVTKDTFKNINVEPAKAEILKTFPTMLNYITSVFEGRELTAFPAIYMGTGHILVVFNKGVKVIPLKFFEKYIVEARRLN